MWVVLVVVAVLVSLIAVTVTVVMARRLDRLHQTVVKSRRALELALRARAEYARAYALSGEMDFAAAILLTDAAEACISAGVQPIINDGLDRLDNLSPSIFTNDRRPLESALSRALRLTIDDNADEAELAGEEFSSGVSTLSDIPVMSENLFSVGDAGKKRELLERARLDVRMTRTFHNSHVDQIRRLRRSAWVRLFHLAGKAPIPITVDIDDE